MAPRWPKITPRWPRDGLSGSQDGPKMAQHRPLGPSWVILGPFWGLFWAKSFEKQKAEFSPSLFNDFLIHSWPSGGYFGAIMARRGAMLGPSVFFSFFGGGPFRVAVFVNRCLVSQKIL